MIVSSKIENKLYKVEKPERYIGREWNQIKKEWTTQKKKILLCFPDTYEIGMSHLGIKILYHLLNKQEDILCERAFAPWIDLENLLREEGLPLFSLESGHRAGDFDIIGFTLQYEMSYTNIINMLDLANIPLYTEDRDGSHPLIIGGGSTVYNSEPAAPFFDLIFIGEAEDFIIDLVNTYFNFKNQGLNRKDILKKMSKLPGVYVPSMYEVSYHKSGGVKEFNPKFPEIKKTIKRQIVNDLDQSFYPTGFLVPFMDIVHNRAVIEVARGCTRGCRFCAAGMTYRPVRERSKERILELAEKILEKTGYSELSLNSLSTVDYSDIETLVKELTDRFSGQKISISLPSLRIDEFSVRLAEEVQKVRKSGLTFAPEAGTERLRRVINKGVGEKDLYQAVRAAFNSGWDRIKLYFMIGLPTETRKDLEGIVSMVDRVKKIGRQTSGRRTNIEVSVSSFIPKPFTPFQWVAMENRESIEKKQSYLRNNIKGRGVHLSWNEPDMSLVEGLMARGDRRLAPVIEKAWQKGARFDGWNELFDFSLWEDALHKSNLKFSTFISGYSPEKCLPWAHINMGVDREFLYNEYKKALSEELTPDCRHEGRCTGCGINLLFPEADLYAD